MKAGARPKKGERQLEDPCIGVEALRIIQRDDPARLCPRYELDDDERVLSELAIVGARLGADHPLWGRLFDLVTEGLDAEARLAVLRTVVGVLSDDGIAARIKLARERAAKEAPKQ